MAGIISSIFSSSNNNKTFKVNHLLAVTANSFSHPISLFCDFFLFSASEDAREEYEEALSAPVCESHFGLWQHEECCRSPKG